MSDNPEGFALASKEVRVEMRLRNNRLWNLIFSRWDSVAAFCRDLELHQVEVGELLNLKPGVSPIRKKSGKYREVCEKIATHFHLLAEDVFPLDIYNLKQTSGSAEIGIELLPYYECRSLAAPQTPEALDAQFDQQGLVQQVLARVTARQRRFLMRRFGLGPYKEHTYEELGDAEEVEGSRAQQIVAKAIRKLQSDPKVRSAFHAMEFGGLYVHPDTTTQCDEILHARAYIDDIYDALCVLRKGVTDGQRLKLDAWLDFNGCAEKAHMHYYWPHSIDREILEIVLPLCQQPLLVERLAHVDACKMMGFARLHPILQSHRVQVQELFWAYYRRTR